MRKLIWLIVLALGVFRVVSAQERKSINAGIINGRAINLPIPDYPDEAANLCVGGKVEIDVLVGENGTVLEARAFSGDTLLRDVSVDAVKRAKFIPAHGIPVKYRGVVVYNFDSFVKCPNAGVVNKTALKLPLPRLTGPIHPKHLTISREQIVGVQIVIGINGKVIVARALNGHPLLRAAFEAAARHAEFSPTLITSQPVRIKALLIYKVKADGSIETDIDKDDKNVVKTPIDLVEPPPPFCNCRFGQNPSVPVAAKTDGQGNVAEARALAGHPILKAISEKAALGSRFLPTGRKAKITFIYHFESTGEGGREVKINSIEIKDARLDE